MKLGDYEVERELGRGGMGVVYRARHVPTGAPRAVKVLESASSPEVLARFRREAEALGRVAGDGVVPVHEVGVANGRVFFAMGVMPGGSLRDKLAREGALEWRAACTLVAALARALARCHAAGIVHRDLKPDNVLFDEEGRPRIADFGLARDLGGQSLTETGSLIGTPDYMPPEQLGGEKVDARADIYALGAMLHELLAGEPPLTTRPLLALYEAKKRGDRRPLPAGVPRPVAALVASALSPRKEDRPPAAIELARELDALVAKGASGVPSAGLLLLGGGLVLGALGALLVIAEASRPATPATAPPPPAVTLAPDDALRARIEGGLHEAAVVLARKGSVSVATQQVAAVLSVSRGGALPSDAVQRFAAVAQWRCDGIVGKIDIGKSQGQEYAEVAEIRSLSKALGAPLPMTSHVAALAGLYALRQKSMIDDGGPRTQWPAIFDAIQAATETPAESVPMMGDLAYVIDEWLEHGHPGSIDRAIDLLGRCVKTASEPAQRFRAERARTKFFAHLRRWDPMLASAIACLEISDERADAADVADAMTSVGEAPQPPLPAAQLEKVVALSKRSPDLLVFQVLCEPLRDRACLREALEGGILGLYYLGNAAVRLRPGDVKPCIAALAAKREPRAYRIVAEIIFQQNRQGLSPELAPLMPKDIDHWTEDERARLEKAISEWGR